MLFDLLSSGLRRGLLLVPLALGVHVSFRFARYPDLTPDGSFIIGGAVAAVLAAEGMDPLVSLWGGAVAGGLLGALTAAISEYLRVDRVLAGIAVALFSYSLALRVMGRGNLALPRDIRTIYEVALNDTWVTLAVVCTLLVVTVIVSIGKVGLRLRLVGENQDLATALGANAPLRHVLGLAAANACVGLSGALLLQYQRFADVSQGAGMLFVGLACVLLGTLSPRHRTVFGGLVASAIGAIVYAELIAFALRLGLTPGDIRAMTALLVIVASVIAGKLFRGGRLPLFG